jgi:signal-transduction protein with cAMP-binding, CBS, and nucleotidyltransferase domain
MDAEPAARIDGFPYRRRARDVMTAPAVMLDDAATLGVAIETMTAQAISSVLVRDGAGRAAGIVTERDALRALARGDGLERPIREVMTAPVAGVGPDDFLYRAIGRMDRMGVRHLPVLDADGQAQGMLSARALLKLRSGLALTIGDEVDVAPDAAALRAAHAKLPQLARGLLEQGVDATDIAAVVAAVTRDMTARAATLALQESRDAGRGAPPCRWCLLVLGSAGRGDSLLAPDQDNALVLDPPADADAASVGAWFAPVAARLNEILAEAGIPLCKGGVMAREPAFRRSLEAWRTQIGAWTDRPDGAAVLAADIFFDLAPVAGDLALGDRLRGDALARAAVAPVFLRQLAADLGGASSVLGWFGRFRLTDGRVDLKRAGTLPLVAGLRALALKRAIATTSTLGRLAALRDAGAIGSEDAAAIDSAYRTIVGAILRQQIADLAVGRPPGPRVDPTALGRPARRALRAAVERAALMPAMVNDALAG